jgi:hypothetical protein
MSSSHPLDDPDHQNQADGVEAHDSSQNTSVITRPRSPTPNDSPKLSTDAHADEANRANVSVNNERNNSSGESGDHQHDVSSSSRPGSNHANRLVTPNQGPSRSPSSEQLQIPINGLNNERVNSPPPPSATAGITSIVLFSPLLKKSCSDKEQDLTRSPSEMSRASSSTSMASNEKLLEGSTVTPRSRRESNASSQSPAVLDQKAIRYVNSTFEV